MCLWPPEAARSNPRCTNAFRDWHRSCRWDTGRRRSLHACHSLHQKEVIVFQSCFDYRVRFHPMILYPCLLMWPNTEGWNIEGSENLMRHSKLGTRLQHCEENIILSFIIRIIPDRLQHVEWGYILSKHSERVHVYQVAHFPHTVIMISAKISHNKGYFCRGAIRILIMTGTSIPAPCFPPNILFSWQTDKFDFFSRWLRLLSWHL